MNYSHLTINKDDTLLIFSEGFQSSYFIINKYGNFNGDILEVCLDYYDNNIQSLELVSLMTKVYYGQPNIERVSDPEIIDEFIDIIEDDNGRNFKNDFELYIDNTSLTFLFKSDSQLKSIYTGGDRMEIGYDINNKLLYIKIKNLIDEEYNQFVNMLDELNVPIIKK